MPGSLAKALSRILSAAGAQAAITSGGAAGRVFTGIGAANARAYSRMLGEEIVSAVGRNSPARRRGIISDAYEEETKPAARRVAGIGGSRIIMQAAAATPSVSGRIFGGLVSLAKGLPLIGKVIAGVALFGVAVAKASAQTVEANRVYARWTPGAAIAMQGLDVRRLMRTMRTGKEMENVIRWNVEEQNRLEEAWRPFGTRLQKMWTGGVAAGAGFAADILEVAEWAASGFTDAKANEIKARKMRGGLPVWSPIGEAWSKFLWPGIPGGRPFVVPIVKAPGEI